MKTIIKAAVLVMMVLPGTVIAATDCKVTEYPDHFEVMCVGDEQPGILQKQTSVQTPSMYVTAQEKAQSVKAANRTDASQTDKIIQAVDMPPANAPGKTPLNDQPQVLSQRGVDTTTSPQTQHSARTTALESAIAARRKLILDLR